MNRAQKVLQGDSIVVGDGAMGTMLHSMGVSLSQSFDEFNISRSEMVSDVHRAYVDAGANLIETNTFGANRLKLDSYGLGSRTRDINLAGARLARECAGTRALIAGSVGPTGKLLHPLGQMTFDEVYEAFKEQISALCEGGVDLMIIETIQDLREMKAAIIAAQGVTDLPIICQMSFAQEGRTMMGTNPGTAAVVLEGMKPALIGTNCGTGPQDMLDVVRGMSPMSGLGITAQPNAGLPRFYEGRLMYLSTPEYMAGFARLFVEAGAVLVGGCCGTTPDHIRALAAAVAGMKRTERRATESVRLAGRSRYVQLTPTTPILMRTPVAFSKARPSSAQEHIDAEVRRGAQVVSISCDGVESACSLVESAQTTGDAAIYLTGSDPARIEQALRAVEGRAMVHCGDCEKVLPIAARYGAVVAADAAGQTPEGRLQSARGILHEAYKHGLSKADIIIKTNDLPTVAAVKSELGLSMLVDGIEDPSALRAFIEAGVEVVVGDPSTIGEVA